MFGATVLVPLLMGFSPSVSVMCSGLGTIIYLLCTKQRIPSYLGPSFSFIGPIVAASAVCGPSGVGSGIVAAGLVFAVIAFVIWRVGTRWIDALVPTPVMAAIIIVIGCGLAATAVSEAFLDGAGNPRPWQEITVAFVALLVVVACTCFGKRLLGTIPVLAGAAAAYVLACAFGLVDFSAVAQAPWFGLPELTLPSFDQGAIALVAPIALVVVIEHIGHLFVIGQNTRSRVLHRSILGDGLATIAAGFLGAPPATTFAENIGVMSVTRVYATQIFWYAAGAALAVGGFCPKLGALVGTIPDPVHRGRIHHHLRPHRLQRLEDARGEQHRPFRQPHRHGCLRPHRRRRGHAGAWRRHPDRRLLAARPSRGRAAGHNVEPGSAQETGRKRRPATRPRVGEPLSPLGI